MKARIALFVIFLAVASMADIPRTIQYQGKLTDMSGIGENDTLDMRFRVFDVETGGDSLWAMTVADVPILHGLFDVNIGPIDLPFNEQYWLEIIVAGNTLSPRVQLTTSPYSFRAAVADSFTGGVPPWTQDTMVAHWDSLRGMPADIADGDQFDTTIAHWGTVRDIPADIADGDQIDTMIAHWDSIRGIPDNLGNSDSIWSKDAAISDTIVLMANAKIHGELIADSIQAVGENIILDDHIDIHGCASLYKHPIEVFYTEGFESGDPPTGWWEFDAEGDADLSYVSLSSNPSGFSPTEGTKMVQFNSWDCGWDDSIKLQQITGFSTIGYSSIVVSFDMLHSLGWSYTNDRVSLRYSINGSSWITAGTFNRYDGFTSGWKTHSIELPDTLSDRPVIYLSFLFVSGDGGNIHVDNLIVSGSSPAHVEFARICEDGVDFDSDVTANSFIGDGSALTGIDLDDEDWIVSGTKLYSNVSGNVGIGTTDPIDLLHVEGFDDTFGANDSVFISLRNRCNSDNALAGIRFKSHSGDGNNFYKSAIAFQRNNTWGRGDLHFIMNNEENDLNAGISATKMTLTGSGLLGIGTRTPNSPLTFANSTGDGFDEWSDYKILLYTRSTPQGSYGIGIKDYTVAFNSFRDFDFDQEGATVMTIQNGKMGIGTTAPARQLHISEVMRLEPIPSAPSSPSEGDIYMDSTTHKLMVYDGTTWQACW